MLNLNATSIAAEVSKSHGLCAWHLIDGKREKNNTTPIKAGLIIIDIDNVTGGDNATESGSQQETITMPREQTYIMIKPDGVQRGLIGEIIARFEKKGFKLSAMKMMSPSKAHLETHYADLKKKPFFEVY